MLEMTSRLALQCITSSDELESMLIYNFDILMADAWNTLCSHCIIMHARAQLIGTICSSLA